MKLKHYNPVNTPVKQHRIPFIYINFKTGLININKLASEIIGLKHGSRILLLQNEEVQEDWYLQVITDKKTEAFELRNNSTSTKGCLLNHRSITTLIANSVHFEGQSGRIFIGEKIHIKGTGDLWSLITASLKNT